MNNDKLNELTVISALGLIIAILFTAILATDFAIEKGTYAANIPVDIAVIFIGLVLTISAEFYKKKLGYKKPQMSTIYKTDDGCCKLITDYDIKCGKDCRECMLVVGVKK